MRHGIFRHQHTNDNRRNHRGRRQRPPDGKQHSQTVPLPGEPPRAGTYHRRIRPGAAAGCAGRGSSRGAHRLLAGSFGPLRRRPAPGRGGRPRALRLGPQRTRRLALRDGAHRRTGRRTPACLARTHRPHVRSGRTVRSGDSRRGSGRLVPPGGGRRLGHCRPPHAAHRPDSPGVPRRTAPRRLPGRLPTRIHRRRLGGRGFGGVRFTSARANAPI